MEIESMVANSALIKAREGGSRGRSYKWKEMLRLNHISQCMDQASSIEREYYSLCVKQPIGKNLFQLFCRSRPDLQNFISLLDALDAFEMKSDEERKDFGVSIIERFLMRKSMQCVYVVQKHEQSCIHSLEVDSCTDVFQSCRERPITKYRFRQYRVLGKGGFGEVWACQVRATGMMYACKKLDKTHVKKRRGEAMALNEKQILEALDSRFVVSLGYAYETKHSLCMVLTMMSGGDLRFHIHNIGQPGLDKNRVRFYAAEVCCGIMHLHRKSIVYRDMKPENILLDDNGHIRISDLGLAVRLSEGSLVRGKVGTAGYMAPEVIGHKHYGLSVDWWGLGCLIYEMTAGKPPLRQKGEHPKAAEMERRIQNEPLEFGEKFGKSVKNLCSSLLNKDPNERLGCLASGGKDVQDHRFFRKVNFRMLEAGLVEPPFKPDPRLVYCSDVQDIDEFSTVKGVTLGETDCEFYCKFNTGSVSINWQNEVIETGCFKELNVFGPEGSRSSDLDWTQTPESPKRSLLDRIFRRNHPQEASDDSRQGLHSNESYMKSGMVSTSM
ncbi:G protein-coupled receptor kinase 5-like isoform X2 [Gymnodraco acuticeps]|uniref:G protein-coupled receptor kinase n=1 Tax=Gymnodraco acuticeps TaxID=8218 RepID=A0A6P8U5I0_GYMAC|nr:G protein-coupled receptor kinase 5-like isoform X2 [Gymnodraco acuticeps]